MANETKPTLQSRSTARVLDVISEGEIYGLINGDKSIYLNETPLQAAGGGYNFQGVRTIERKGTVSQAFIPGFGRGETETNDGRQIENGSPITFTVSDEDVNAVFLKFRTPQLYEQNDKGKLKTTKVELEIEIKPNGGSYSTVGYCRISGRTTSGYDRQKRITIPDGDRPYTVRIKRNTANSVDANLQNATYLISYTSVNDWKLRYSYTALIGIEVDAEKFGSSFPERRYNVGGMLISYPSNYNPTTRAYSGVWDGTFTSGSRCDNPAWVLWDICRKGRYGLGHVLPASGLDKWALYSIAQYCDELVPDGNGGTEPRFTFNGEINNRDEAVKWLDRIASVFRGMLYWSAGNITFTQDKPGDVVLTVTRSNVIGGVFNYAGAARKARHSHIVVSYNDPDRLGDLNYEMVSRNKSLGRHGYNPLELAALGCTSRAQARRMAEAIFETEDTETQTVTYRAGLDHATARPGQLVNIYDPWYQGARFGGRVLSVAGDLKSVTIDAPVTISAGLTYYLRITMADGTIQERELTNSAASGVTVLTFADALPETPVTGAVWGLANDNVNPRTFRIISGNMVDDHIFEINAAFHDPTKYDRIDRDLRLPKPGYTAYNAGPLAVPTDLTVTETKSDNGDEYAASALLSWKPANDARVTRYLLQIWDGDDTDWQPPITVYGTSFSYDQCPTGDLKFRVRSLSNDERYAKSGFVTSATETITGYAEPTPYTALTVVGRFRKNILKFAANTDEKFRRAVIYGSDTNNFGTASVIGYAPLGVKTFVEEDLTTNDTRYYWIAPQDKFGRIGTRYPNTTAGVVGTTRGIKTADVEPLQITTGLVEFDQFAAKMAISGNASGTPANSNATGTVSLCSKTISNPNPSAVHIQITYKISAKTTANSTTAANGTTAVWLEVFRGSKLIWSATVSATTDSEHLGVTKAKAPVDQYVHFIDFDPPQGNSTYSAQLRWKTTAIPAGGTHAYSGKITMTCLWWKR